MKALAKGITQLKSLRLAYSNLKPKNVLVNKQDHVKIRDFNYTNSISLEFKAYIPLYRRLLNSEARLEEGTIGKLRAYIE